MVNGYLNTGFIFFTQNRKGSYSNGLNNESKWIGAEKYDVTFDPHFRRTTVKKKNVNEGTVREKKTWEVFRSLNVTRTTLLRFNDSRAKWIAQHTSTSLYFHLQSTDHSKYAITITLCGFVRSLWKISGDCIIFRQLEGIFFHTTVQISKRNIFRVPEFFVVLLDIISIELHR